MGLPWGGVFFGVVLFLAQIAVVGRVLGCGGWSVLLGLLLVGLRLRLPLDDIHASVLEVEWLRVMGCVDGCIQMLKATEGPSSKSSLREATRPTAPLRGPAARTR